MIIKVLGIGRGVFNSWSKDSGSNAAGLNATKIFIMCYWCFSLSFCLCMFVGHISIKVSDLKNK